MAQGRFICGERNESHLGESQLANRTPRLISAGLPLREGWLQIHCKVSAARMQLQLVQIVWRCLDGRRRPWPGLPETDRTWEEPNIHWEQR